MHTDVVRQTRSRDVWGWLERALLVIGLALIGYYVYVSVETQLYQAMENRELDAILASAPPAPAPRGLPPPVPGSTLGRIEIPRLGVSAVIRAGSDARTLRRSGCCEIVLRRRRHVP